ncbi:methylated-DNA--[protein]-cysteine S-methyltransferase [Streptomyces angustmyceticus]|uniref:Methylated-DNA--protein-cysteine methyltransferase n=1 Tax=Streptomyces angustmyceticus TaxID=285578 RepID=A0A5J4LJF8_9ACTN|nr:methylated-DNA--[protein]-cysteine S-methyltransferase [Streptomyces angustmyceticus]UAL71686.1 methylated-DNA--[protein]-cysteine S-methyltransferase [Streptomyces angustmyceticus]GES32634.1 methylated-DNA--protein-cysteine methyltransferase [Streptomyces angustmyceticus]
MHSEQVSRPAAAPDAGPAAAAARRDWARTRLATPIGPLLLAATEEGLVRVVFHADERTARRETARLERLFGGPPLPALPAPATAAAADELTAYFAGELRSFTVPLDWSLSSGFSARVLQALAAHVPYGSVVGYQDLADRVGEPGAARAVGAAMGSNPLPVVVPCHRVVASDGGIGGFGGGLETKRALLALEGVLPAPLF